MSDPIYTGPPIGETELFQTYSDSTVEADPTLDEFANTLSGEPYASGANSTETPLATEGIQSVGSSEPVLDSVTQPLPQTEFFTQDFPDRDPLSYDFGSAIDQGYAFLRPQEIIPEGVEAVYAATERDPFRQDWSEADFRTIEDYTYTQGRLDENEMNRVAEAYNFLGSIALEAEEGGWSSTEDYLRHIQQSNPERYNELVNDFNINAGYVEQYGDQYKFQANLGYADQIATDPLNREGLIESSIDFLRDYVAAGYISPEEAAYLAEDPVNLISMISQGDFTRSQQEAAGEPEVFFYSSDVDQTRPYVRQGDSIVPFLAENEFVDDQGRVLRIDGEQITVVRDQLEYDDPDATGGEETTGPRVFTRSPSTGGGTTTGTTGGTTQTTTGTGTATGTGSGATAATGTAGTTTATTTGATETTTATTTGTTGDTGSASGIETVSESSGTGQARLSGLVDADGNNIIYAGWDTEGEYGFVFDPLLGDYRAPLAPGESIAQMNDGRTVIVDSNGIPQLDITNYPDFNTAPSGIGDPNDDGITAVDVPVTSEGTYDLYTDSQRALSDVADFYTGPGATLDLGEAFRTNFGSSNPVYDETLFSETERPDWYSDYPNLPVATTTITERVPREGGRGNFSAIRGWGSPTRTVTVNRYLSRPSDADLVSYEDQPVLQYNDSFRFGGEDSEWLNEKFDELVQTRPYGRSDRAARAFAGGGFGNPWTFDIATDPLVQQSLFEALVDYSDTTGVPIERIHNSRYEDIGSWDEGNTDVFDIEHFMSGSEESGWGGFIPIFRDLASDYALGSVGSEQELLGTPELERMAFLSSAVFRPLARQVDSIIEEREGGFSFDQNVSIPSEYNNRFGLRPTPDYLQNSLYVGGPEDEPPGLFAEGGYIGGIAGGMDDTVPASIDGSQPAALSSGEFVVPADVVSHLGDGNNQNGAAKLYNFMDQVRTVKTGSTEQPDPFNDGIMANMIGEPYGQ